MSSNVRALILELIRDNNVMMFTKTYCPYCTKAKNIFKELNIPFKSMELDEMSDGGEIQTDLADLTGQKTVPNIFIKGKHVGGCDTVTALKNDGKLLAMTR